NATIRFWINVESLNRPPTLLTIPSSLSSSSMVGSPCEESLNNGLKLVDRRIQIVVDHSVFVIGGPVDFALCGRQTSLNRCLILGAALAKPIFVGCHGRGLQ